MLSKKRSAFILICVLALLMVVSCTGLAAKTIKAKVAHLAPTNDPRHESLVKFVELVKEKSNGRIQLTIYPNSTLGSERELFEQLQAGVTEFALVGNILGNFVPEFSCLGLPFFWRDYDHQQAVVMGSIGKPWRDELVNKFGVGLFAIFKRNPRILVNTKRPVTKLEDVKGMKVRVPELPMSMRTWRAFGVQPTPMPTSEFYMGLRLGIIDAMENPVEVMYNWKIWEVAKYLSKTEHELNSFVFIYSNRFMKSLSPADQKLVKEAAAEAQAYYDGLMADMAAFCYAELEKNGMIINEVDKSGFIAASREVHEDFKKSIGTETFNKIVELGK
ncbi:MAG TPA: TRAP transporter substrate-binding protein [Firmicutes bacterium]|nr:TRAP transporter substrate-binding protein [Bacillota bacterium]